MARYRRWIKGALLVAAGATLAVLGPQFYTAIIKPMTSQRWSDLSQAERDERNRANDVSLKKKQDDAEWRAKLLAKGEDPEMDVGLNRDNPQTLREIATKQAQAMADQARALQQERENSPAALAKKKALEDEGAARVAIIQNPDGNIVRMTPAEDAAAVAKIDKALGGASPFTPIDSIMRARHPWYIRFQDLDFLGRNGMDAVMSQSHPKSHFAIVNNMTGIEKGLARPCIAVWIKGANGKTKIVFTTGFAQRTNTAFIAVGMKDGKEIVRTTLQLIPGAKVMYVMNDMPFTFLAIYGDTVSEANMLYALEVSPALAARHQFFAAY